MRHAHAAALLRVSLLAAVFACAASGAKTGVTPGHDPLVITSDEIDTVRFAYVIDVVKQARPNWLTMNSSLGSGVKRAQGFAIYEDNTRWAGSRC